MDLHDFFKEQVDKSKRYVQLQDKGLSQIEAAYAVFGTETGDAILKLRQHEIVTPQNPN